MTKETTQPVKIKKRNRLFFKVYGNYALMVTLFAVILGFTFMNLYQSINLENNSANMYSQAESIASQLEEYIDNEDYLPVLSYLKIISSMKDMDIWTIANSQANEPMNDALVNIDLTGETLPVEQEEVIQGAFAGNNTKRIYYSDIHGYTLLTVGVPVYNTYGEVCGVVMLNLEMSSLDEGVNNILMTIVISAGLAMVVSFILAFLFVRQLTVPISIMRSTALELTAGHYKSKTGIKRNDELGELALTIDFLTDKLQENEIERQNLECMRMDFFANVSHELRTPITVVRAYTESLVDGIITDEKKVSQYYERMLSECKSMERLVGDLLTLSKMQNPDFVIEKEPINIVQVFDEIVRSAGKIAEQKNIKISVQADSDIHMMYGDYDRLRQMFMVILDNAIKFSNSGSTVHVTIVQEDKLKITIRDEGIGISKEDLLYVFDKFYKSNLRQNAKGSGLGLSIARQIAVKHGGNIEVFSKLGEGSEFVFTFDFILEKDIRQN